MPELRIDPLSGHRTIVAGERSRRPGGEPRSTPAEPIDASADPFADGHEDRTPPELFAVRPDGGRENGPGWTVRVVPNLYPALDPPGSSPSTPAGEEEGGRGAPDLFQALPATGAHEVIVNAPQPVVSLAELPASQVVAAVDVWREAGGREPHSGHLLLIVHQRRP